MSVEDHDARLDLAVLTTRFDELHRDVEEIRHGVRQINERLVGNGKLGIIARLRVVEFLTVMVVLTTVAYHPSFASDLIKSAAGVWK